MTSSHPPGCITPQGQRAMPSNDNHTPMVNCGQPQQNNHRTHKGKRNLRRGTTNHHRAHQLNPIPREIAAQCQRKINPAKRANINVATLNVRGATAENVPLLQKWSSISKTIYENRIAVLAIQETHLDQSRTRQIRECFSKNLDIITSEDPDDPTGRAGVDVGCDECEERGVRPRGS